MSVADHGATSAPQLLTRISAAATLEFDANLQVVAVMIRSYAVRPDDVVTLSVEYHLRSHSSIRKRTIPALKGRLNLKNGVL